MRNTSGRPRHSKTGYSPNWIAIGLYAGGARDEAPAEIYACATARSLELSDPAELDTAAVPRTVPPGGIASQLPRISMTREIRSRGPLSTPQRPFASIDSNGSLCAPQPTFLNACEPEWSKWKAVISLRAYQPDPALLRLTDHNDPWPSGILLKRSARQHIPSPRALA